MNNAWSPYESRSRLFFVSFQPKEGWTVEVKMEKLDPPVELFGTEYTERVAEVTWSGGKIGPGEFDELGMSARIPDAAGTDLVFPVVQTYSTGEVVRWIGEPDAETPAPRVSVLAAPAEGEAAAADDATEDDDTRTNLALGFGIAGLVAGSSRSTWAFAGGVRAEPQAPSPQPRSAAGRGSPWP